MRILVVDDDPVSRRLVQATLSSFGHASDAADSGESAWEAFSASPYDVVVSDRDMPGMSGIELCRRIRSDPAGRRAYVVMVTVRGQRDDVVDGFAAGADDYLTKPLDIAELQLRLIVAERVSSLHAQLEEKSEELRRAVRTDPLTQVGNRLAMHEELALLHARVERYGECYSVALVDVDNFKAYNDTYGHLAGDRTLVDVASLLAGEVRKGDAVFRFGGEEFLCVLPAQQVAGAEVAMERVRRAVRGLDIPHSANPAGILTISVGVASFVKGQDRTPEQVVKAADDALYAAKDAGRDRVAHLPA